MTNDYLKLLAENAAIVRERLGRSDDGKLLSIYKGVETWRVTRVSTYDKIEVRVGAEWRSAFVNLTGLNHLMVK